MNDRFSRFQAWAATWCVTVSAQSGYEPATRPKPTLRPESAVK